MRIWWRWWFQICFDRLPICSRSGGRPSRAKVFTWRSGAGRSSVGRISRSSRRRIAVRCRKANGQWGYAVLIAPSDLKPVWSALHPECEMPIDPLDQLLAAVYAYDGRGGGIETSLKEDKQGLGLTRRQKRRFAAQQMLTLLSTLAHNVLIWTRRWLAASEPKLARYGLKRLVRDIFHINGRVLCDALGHVVAIFLNPVGIEKASASGMVLKSTISTVNISCPLSASSEKYSCFTGSPIDSS